jgi:hypothetical protein
MAVANYATAPVDPDQLHLPRPAELEAILTAPIPGHPGSTLADALPADDNVSASGGPGGRPAAQLGE